MKQWQKAAIGWGSFILIAIGIANASTPTSVTIDSVQTPQTTNAIRQQTTSIKTKAAVRNYESPTSVKTYVNSVGNTVQSPTYYQSQPVGATAKCRDGTYSFSQSRRGTCSHHGGVARWI